MSNIRPYRGKRIDNDEWVQGSLLELWKTDVKPSDSEDGIHDLVDVKAYYIVKEVHTDFEFDDEYRHEVRPETIGQLIGLNDKNGKEICEGDIDGQYDRDYGYRQVVYKDGQYGLQYADDVSSFDPFILWDSTVIIGNKHDNPELLEVNL